MSNIVNKLEELLIGWKKAECGFGSGICFISPLFNSKLYENYTLYNEILIRCYNDGMVTFGWDRTMGKNPAGNPLFTDTEEAYNFIVSNLYSLTEKVNVNQKMIFN